MKTITRRAALSTTGSAAVAVLAGGRVVAAEDTDATFRALLAEYQAIHAETLAAWEVSEQAQEALERRVLGGETLHERGFQGFHLTDEEDAALRREIFHDDKHRGAAYDFANQCSSRELDCIKRIRETPAESMFGIAVKLVALPHAADGYDMEESILYVLEDVNRLLGTTMTLAGESLADHLAFLARLDAQDAEACHA